nr:TPA_asm: PolB [Orchesella springtail adintovirus]
MVELHITIQPLSNLTISPQKVIHQVILNYYMLKYNLIHKYVLDTETVIQPTYNIQYGGGAPIVNDVNMMEGVMEGGEEEEEMEEDVEEVDSLQNDEIEAAFATARASRCHRCNIGFDSQLMLRHHIGAVHQDEVDEAWGLIQASNPMQLIRVHSSHGGAYAIYEVDLSNVDVQDINGLWNTMETQVKEKMVSLYRKIRKMRIQYGLHPQMYQETEDGVRHAFPYFNTKAEQTENPERIMEEYWKALHTFNKKIDDYVELGSGWILERINKLRINVYQIGALLGGGVHFPLPYVLSQKYYCLLNPRGEDNLCFKRAIIASEYVCGKHIPQSIRNRKRTLESNAFHQKYMNNNPINFDGLTFPMTISQIKKFETQNPRFGLNILCFDTTKNDINPCTRLFDSDEQEAYDDEEGEEDDNFDPTNLPAVERQKYIHQVIRDNTFPIAICKEQKEYTIDLLLVVNGTKAHYCLITNLLGLLRLPHDKAHLKHICRYCLNGFSDLGYPLHVDNCAALGLQAVQYPEPGSELYFKNFSHTIPVPFIIYADFESLLIKIQDPTKLHKHRASGYGYAFIDNVEDTIDVEVYIAESENDNIAERMLAQLLALTDELLGKIREYENEAYAMAEISFTNIRKPSPNEKCGFCGKVIFGETPVRHHQHYPPYTWLFYSHNSCNLNAKVRKEIVVFVHNLKGYDSHFLIKALQNQSLVQNIDVIGVSPNKFNYIKVNNKLVFKDSLNFFHASLDSIAKSLDEKDFVYTKRFFARFLIERFKNKTTTFPDLLEMMTLLQRKNVYPYSYFDCDAKYNETKLPPRKEFYNDLTEKPVSDADYKHAHRVMDLLQIKDLREYTKIYLLCDVCILADCFQTFRNMFLKNFGLEPAAYFSLPQLTWDLALKKSGVRLELITDPTMHVWMEDATRGGLCTSGDIRAAAANNKYMPDYDASKPSTFISYLDKNNLYPTVMTYKLPLCDFEWVEGQELEEISRGGKGFITSLEDDDDYGYFFEVDLCFPPETHELFNAFPPAPYKRSVDYTELSPLQQYYADILQISDASLGNKRLVTDLHNRTKYKVHYRVLKLYLQLGVELVRIHSAIRFFQSDYLSEYINDLATRRALAKSKIEQNFYKLLGNALFGKTIENLRNRSIAKVVRSREEALKYNAKPNLQNVMLIEKDRPSDGDLAIVSLKPSVVYLNKPLYIGITVLDESKRLMYDFYYNKALKYWGANGKKVHLIYSDTDSLITLINTDDYYRDMYRKRKNTFDMSDFDKDHKIWGKFHCPNNRKRLGFMKDEAANKVITRFCVARPKMYTYRYLEDGEERVAGQTSLVQRDVKKGKGISTTALEKRITFDQYQQALDGPVNFSVEMRRIVSKKHDVFTVKEHKKGLSGFDVKRYIFHDSVQTLAFGHCSFNETTEEEVEAQISDIDMEAQISDTEMEAQISDTEMEAQFSDTEY